MVRRHEVVNVKQKGGFSGDRSFVCFVGAAVDLEGKELGTQWLGGSQ